MRENVVRTKSFLFAVRVVRLCQYLQREKLEWVLSKQLLRSGSGVGALIREAEHAESRSDFRHKMGVAQKEINETLYWLELLKATNYLNDTQFDSVNKDAVELIKLITSILKSSKNNG
ncbi:MAG: four helix bundle protein [Chitinophagales bacterium]|jgi:four helix bundle protein